MTTVTLSGVYANGYTLASKFTGVSITGAGSVSSAPGADAAYYGGAGAAAGAALTLPNGGSVINSGQITGGAGGAGGYGGANYVGVAGGAGGNGGAGVTLSAAGQVINHGVITGGAGGYGGAGSPGYYYPGGGVSAGGAGGAGGYGGAGVLVAAGGRVVNFGTIDGGASGYGGYAGNAYAQAGAAGGGGGGVVFYSGGSLTNLGVIEGGAGGGVADGEGVVLAAGGGITNGSSTNHGALIKGYDGVYVGGAGTVTNFGTIAATAGDSVYFKSSGGRLIAEAGSDFVGQAAGAGGTLELAGGAGAISGLGSTAVTTGSVSMTFSGFGAYVFDSGSSWTLTGPDTLAHGKTLTDGGAVTLNGALTNAGLIRAAGGGTIGVVGATVNNAGGTLSVGAGSVMTLQNATVAGGAIDLFGAASAAKLVISGTSVTLSGKGQVNLSNASSNIIVGATSSATLTNVNDRIKGGGQLGDGSMILINEAGGVIANSVAQSLTINTGANTIQSAGTIAGGPGGLTVQSALDNTGILLATSGTLSVIGPVTGSGRARINGGTLAIGANPFAEAVTFSGPTGVLKLADSQGFSGKVAGLSSAGTNSIDLVDISYKSGVTKASYSGSSTSGVLTVTDGSHMAHIKLFGDYIGASWVLSAAAGGGTKVVDPATATPSASMAPHAFVQAIASLAAPAHAMTDHGHGVDMLRPTLAALVTPRA